MLVTEIQGLAREIMEAIGMGYDESIYRTALYREILAKDPSSGTMMLQNIPILYKGQFLGTCKADIVTCKYVIEIKAVKTLLCTHDIVGQHIKNCLKHLHFLEPQKVRVGLVINFNQQSCTPEFMLYHGDYQLLMEEDGFKTH